MEKGKREALKALAVKGGVTAADLTRLLIDAALRLGVPGITSFLKQAAESKRRVPIKLISAKSKQKSKRGRLGSLRANR